MKQNAYVLNDHMLFHLILVKIRIFANSEGVEHERMENNLEFTAPTIHIRIIVLDQGDWLYVIYFIHLHFSINQSN